MQFGECNINLSLVKPLALAWFRFDCVYYRYFDRINVSCYVQIRQYCVDSYSVYCLLSCRVMINWPMVGNMNPCFQCIYWIYLAVSFGYLKILAQKCSWRSLFGCNKNYFSRSLSYSISLSLFLSFSLRSRWLLK